MQPTTLVLFAVTGGLPAWHYQPARVAGLFRDLDSYRFTVREQATRELVNLGGPIVPSIKAQLAAPPSEEFARRAERVLREVRYRSAVGGPVVGGFRATLRLAEEEFAAGEDVALELEIARVSHDAMPIQPPVRWQLAGKRGAPGGLDCMASSVDAEIVLRPLSGRHELGLVQFMMAGPRNPSAPALARDQSIVERVVLGPSGQSIPAGAYEAQLFVQLMPYRPASKDPLVTNTVRFTVGGKK